MPDIQDQEDSSTADDNGDDLPSLADQPEPAAPQTNIPQLAPPPTAEQRNNQDLAHLQDQQMGHIDPKTYSSLFENKGALGKVGTLFGLMLSGAGSGLAHQPNYLMELMNKELDRDLEAQKQNQSNKLNFYNLTYQHELQEAQARHLNASAAAQMAGIPLTKAQIAQAQALAEKTTQDVVKQRAQNNLLLGTLGYLQDLNKGNPQGQAVIDNHIRPAVIQKVGANNADIANKQSTNYQQSQQQQQQQPQASNGMGVDLNRMNALMEAGKAAPDTPTLISPEEAPTIKQQASFVGANRALYQRWQNAYKALDQQVLAGKLTPGDRDAYVQGLSDQLAKVMGVQSSEQLKGMMSGMLPASGDLPKTRQDKFNQGYEHFKSLETPMTELQRKNLLQEFPKNDFKPMGAGGKQQKETEPKSKYQTTEVRYFQGKPYTRGPNGEPVPVPQEALNGYSAVP